MKCFRYYLSSLFGSLVFLYRSHLSLLISIVPNLSCSHPHVLTSGVLIFLTLQMGREVDVKTDWTGTYRGPGMQVQYNGTTTSIVHFTNTKVITKVGPGAWSLTDTVGGNVVSIGLSFKYKDGSRTLEAVDTTDATFQELEVKKRHCKRVEEFTDIAKEVRDVNETDNAFVAFSTLTRV